MVSLTGVSPPEVSLRVAAQRVGAFLDVVQAMPCLEVGLAHPYHFHHLLGIAFSELFGKRVADVLGGGIAWNPHVAAIRGSYHHQGIDHHHKRGYKQSQGEHKV